MRHVPRALVLATLLASFLLAAVACSAEPPQAPKAPTSSQGLAGLVTYDAPQGWDVETYANSGGADPVVAFSQDLDRITVRAFGAPGSAYASPADFLAGPAATTMGRKPESAGRVTVAGRELELHEHGFPIHLGDPHAPSGPTTLGTEVFCVLRTAGDRFVVLAYARESEVPDLEGSGEKAWEAFLKTVRLAAGGAR